jgi:sugar phosphate isomerase/epimerase
VKREQLAINTVSLKGTFPEIVAGCAEAGFRNIEFVLGQVYGYMQEGHDLNAVKQLLQQHDLRCIGGFEGCVSISGDEESRKGNHARVVENARFLGELGATTLVVGIDGTFEGLDDVAGHIANIFADLSRQIEDTSVNLAIEYNWGPVKSLPLTAEIARRSGASNVGVLFDPAHYHCTPTKFEDLNAANVPFIKHAHVDDMNGKPAELSNCNSDRALPGQGVLDLRAIFGKLEEHGYNGYFSIEMFSDELWALPAREAAQQMYQSLLPLCDG